MTRVAAIGGLLLALATTLKAAQVPVRYPEGTLHGFLALRTLDGETIADGDLVQRVHGSRVTARLTFHFKDGSLHDETAVFSQAQRFRLLSDHLVQKGRSFPTPVDMSIDGRTGVVTVRYTDGGKEKTDTAHVDAPADLANGLILTLLKNIPGNASETFSYVAATPKPRLVTLAVAPAGDERFTTGGEHREAKHFVVKVRIGGVSGLLAPLVGKQPADSQVWVLGGAAPAFVKSEQALYPGGPVWRIELVAPSWGKTSAGY